MCYCADLEILSACSCTPECGAPARLGLLLSADEDTAIPRNAQGYLADDTEEHPVIIECFLITVFAAAYSERNTSLSSLRHVLSFCRHLCPDLQRGVLPSGLRPRLYTHQFFISVGPVTWPPYVPSVGHPNYTGSSKRMDGI